MKDYYSYDDALSTLQKFCKYQPRCHKEVRYKLIKMKVYSDWQDEIILSLMEDDLLNEMRFAEKYTSGKFKIKRWGKDKIKRSLKSKEVSDYCIKKAIESQIDEDKYFETLKSLLIRKNNGLKESLDLYHRKQKLKAHAVSKGYEYHLIDEILKEIL